MRRKMIADAKFIHEGKALSSGDEFEADEEDASALSSRAIRMAHYKVEGIVERVTNGAKRHYRRRDMQADE